MITDYGIIGNRRQEGPDAFSSGREGTEQRKTRETRDKNDTLTRDSSPSQCETNVIITVHNASYKLDEVFADVQSNLNWMNRMRLDKSKSLERAW